MVRVEGSNGEGSREIIQFRGEQDSRRWDGGQEGEKEGLEEKISCQSANSGYTFAFFLFQASGKGNCVREQNSSLSP